MAADLITDLPILDAVRRGMPIRDAPGAPVGLRSSVAVFDKICGTLGTVGEADADQRFDSGQFAELAKLVNANIVRVDTPPVLVRKGDAPVPIPNAVFPSVGAG